MKTLHRVIAASALAGAALAANQAHAALAVGTIPGGSADNEFVNIVAPGKEIEGWYGANIFLTGLANIKVDYYGAEAGFNNSFSFAGCPLIQHLGGNSISGAIVGASCTVNNVAAGLLNFSFSVNGGAGSVANGANPGNVGALPNFFATFDSGGIFDTIVDGSTSGGGQSVFLFLDDGGGGDDDNHDDMVVRLSITGGSMQVPEPASLGLLGLGLVGLAAVRRRSSARNNG